MKNILIKRNVIGNKRNYSKNFQGMIFWLIIKISTVLKNMTTIIAGQFDDEDIINKVIEEFKFQNTIPKKNFFGA